MAYVYAFFPSAEKETAAKTKKITEIQAITSQIEDLQR